ncbi:hypothetical protein EOM09_08930, partial [bacterium]|nr:hypothetical protein [bacterium]
MENLYNLSISSYFDNSSILLTNMTPPYILMKDIEFGNFSSFNSSDTYNISILDFLRVNDSNFHSINSFNYINSSNSTNLSFLNISVSFENVFQELYLRVYSNISLNSSGEIYIDDIGPFYCDILCNLSNLSLEKNFSILFLLKNENFSTNKTWNISYIELYSTYTYRNYSGIKLNNYSIFLDELLLNSSKNFTKDFTLLR